MTTPTDPNALNATAPIAPGPEPRVAMLALCIECGDGIEVPLPVDARWLTFFLAQNGWFTAVLNPPNQGPEVPMLIGALCVACAQKMYSPEVFKIAEQRRQQILQAAQAAQAPQAAQAASQAAPQGTPPSPPTLIVDHAYLSAGDTPHASGDRPYTGCYHCGRPRSEHAQ